MFVVMFPNNGEKWVITDVERVGVFSAGRLILYKNDTTTEEFSIKSISSFSVHDDSKLEHWTSDPSYIVV